MENISLPDQKKQKKLIITGGTEGIGRAIVEELMRRNHKVATCARTREKVNLMRESYSSLFAYEIDLAGSHQSLDFIKNSVEKLGGLDVLILNAGVTGLKESKEYTQSVNEAANVTLVTAAQRALQESNGTIVFITSSTAHTNLNGGIEPYRESKLLVEQWLEEFSKLPGNEEIKVFSVNPGSVNTRMHREVIEYGSGEIKERTERLLKEGLLRDPNIIGKIIAKMSLSNKKFNTETGEYDQSIANCEIMRITDENVLFEKDLQNNA